MKVTPALRRKMAVAFQRGQDMTGTAEVRRMIQAQERRIRAEFQKLPVRVQFTELDPYKSFEEMRDQVRSTGVLRIWTGASDVPMWSPETNWMARAVHDWDHISQQFDFTMDGEYEGFRVAARKAPQLAPIALSEIALQAAVANTEGIFAPDQKIVIDEELVTHLSGVSAAHTRGLNRSLVPAIAAMRNAIGPEETAKTLGTMMDAEDAIDLFNAAVIYDAMVEGQMEQ